MSDNIIFKFLKEHKYSYIVGIFFMLVTSYIQTLAPKILGRTIDLLKASSVNLHLVKIYIIYMLLVAIGTFVCTYAWRNLVVGNARKLECYLREKLFDHFQKLSPEFYNKRKTGDLIAYAINDISAVRMTFGPSTARMVNGVVICAISIYSMAQAISLKLTLIALIPIPFVFYFMLKAGKIVRKSFKKVQKNFATISDKVQENINGIRVIKAYVQEDEEVRNFEFLSDEMMNSNIELVKVSSVLSPIIEICFSISFVLNLIIGGNMVLKGTVSLGSFIAFNGYLMMIITPVISMGRIINNIQRGMASYGRLNEIFSVVPQVVDGEKMLTSEIKGSIQIKNLCFSYPDSDKKALEDINVDVDAGNFLGIVGRTGSGKTTLINLLIKLYNVDRGMIYIDGNDINDYSLETLRNAFGYVPQDNFLFSASIRDNITFFKDEYTKEDIENAAKCGCIYDTIMSFNDGFDTILGERGINISGGQKQRISIARAVIKNPPVLVLDDALSAVDTITEFEILNNLKRIRKRKNYYNNISQDIGG